MEMVSDKAIVFKNEKTMTMCESDDLEHPLTAQLFGSDVESMVEAAIYLDENSKADIIDINMGCPVNKVVKTGAGSALLKDPDKAVKIASEIIKHVKKPVTVKMRLGFNRGDVVCFDLAKRLQEAGVKAIALHARFRSEMYEGKADWSYIKKMKEIATNEKLNKLTEKYPSNIEICKELLEKVDNKNVKIEENVNSEATLYIAISNKILIGNMHDSFTRIQTIAHECLHSIQDRKLLIFNFVFSNIYFLYYIICCILIILKYLPNELLFLNIFLILSFIYYTIRIFLENDAMIKAEYLSNQYLEEKNISNKIEIKEIVKGFKDLNKEIIKSTNVNLFTKIMTKVVIFNLLALIF